MKKSLFVLFAALVLICAVACSSSPKDTGIRIFAEVTGSEELFVENSFVLRYGLVEDAEALEALLEGEEDEIEAYMNTLSKKEVSGAELLEDPITLVLEPGVYFYELCEKTEEGDRESFELFFKAPTKSFHGGEYFVVTDGEFIDYVFVYDEIIG